MMVLMLDLPRVDFEKLITSDERRSCETSDEISFPLTEFCEEKLLKKLVLLFVTKDEN